MEFFTNDDADDDDYREMTYTTLKGLNIQYPATFIELKFTIE